MPRINYWFLFFIIFSLNLLLYFPSLNSYFVNDDYNWLKYKSFYEILSTFWGGWGHGALYRPFTRIFFYIEFIIFGKNPLGFHIVSMFLHSLTLLYIFRTSALLFSSKSAAYIILILSVFFYPFHEAVCWISSQTLLLGSVFISLSLFCYVSYMMKGKKSYYWFSFFAYFFSLLSYESSIALPSLCVISYFIFNQFNLQNLKRIILNLIPFIILSFAYMVYRKIVLVGLPEANQMAGSLSVIILNFVSYFKIQILKNTPLLILFIISLTSLAVIKKITMEICSLLPALGFVCISSIQHNRRICRKVRTLFFVRCNLFYWIFSF